MEEKVIEVFIKDKGVRRKISIEEYDALANKQEVDVLELITNTGTSYAIERRRSSRSYLLDDTTSLKVSSILNDSQIFCVMHRENYHYMVVKGISEEAVRMFFSVDGPYDDNIDKKFQVDMIDMINGITSHGRNVDIDTDDEVKKFINENKLQEAMAEAKKIIARFRSIAGQNLTLRQFRTYIETGRLFETAEERTEFESQLLEKRKVRDTRTQQLHKIEEEITSVKTRLSKLNQQKEQLSKLNQAENHEDEYEL